MWKATDLRHQKNGQIRIEDDQYRHVANVMASHPDAARNAEVILAAEEFQARTEEARQIIAEGVVHLDELEAENGRLKAIIAELVAAGENALHVLTPVRPVMDGLDRTRMYLREAIARAKATKN